MVDSNSNSNNNNNNNNNCGSLLVVMVVVLGLAQLPAGHVIQPVRGLWPGYRGPLHHVTDQHPHQGFYCFQHSCWCQADMADCSGHYGHLTFVPSLPDNIRFLNFSYNNVTNMDDDFFLNVTFINSVDLSGNGLITISNNTFQPLHNLSYLFLNYNHNLTYHILHPVFSVSTLRRLDIRHSTLGPLPDDLFYRYPLPHLHTLYLHENHLNRVNMTVFRPLVALQELGLGGSYITDLHADRLPRLQRLVLDGNRLDTFPDTCSKGRSLFPRLTLLSVGYNQLTSLPDDVYLPRLRVLGISGNTFSRLVTGMFHGRKFPSLLEIHLQGNNRRIQRLEPYTFSNAALNKINLMFNNLKFQDDVIHPDAFAGCPSIINLQLSHNFMDNTPDDLFQRLLGNLTQLRTLYLGDTRLRQLPLHTLGRLTSLRTLSLHDNDLTHIPDGAFDTLSLLQQLDISNNQISVVKETTFSEACRSGLRHLDLSRNPFTCSCDVIWFRDWLRADVSLFHRSIGDYTCGNMADLLLVDFDMKQQACLLSHVTSILIIVLLSLSFIVFIVVSLLHRYRWHIRLVLYEAFRGRRDTWRPLLADNFRYDVFVSYASEDGDWVHGHLLPELEERLGLRLCLHERDFIPGKHIVDNIVQCVEDSRKVMVIFSPDFAVSPWCQFELPLCLSHVMDHDDALVVVCLKDMSSRDLTPAMMAVMKTTTYIQWGEGHDATASFWGRLQIALDDVITPAER